MRTAFLSLFNLTNLAAADAFQYPDAIVDYASAAVFELRQNANGNGHDGELTQRLARNMDTWLKLCATQSASVSEMGRTRPTAFST